MVAIYKRRSRMAPAKKVKVRRCRECACTDADCRGCIERTGKPCHWVEPDLCSACGLPDRADDPIARGELYG